MTFDGYFTVAHNFLFFFLLLLPCKRKNQGGGFQAAAGGDAFDVLLRRFNVKMECFASPFNCRYASYCSAFRDTDAPFGRLMFHFSFLGRVVVIRGLLMLFVDRSFSFVDRSFSFVNGSLCRLHLSLTASSRCALLHRCGPTRRYCNTHTACRAISGNLEYAVSALEEHTVCVRQLVQHPV